MKLTVAGDTSVSPLEELPIAAEVRDDFGVAKVGLAYTFAQPPQEITLGESSPRAQDEINHMIEFEELKAETGPSCCLSLLGRRLRTRWQLRRTESDMYFAEVRPFEEIFREGEPPPGGQSQQQQQSQNGQKAEELAELQKEIINATWRVLAKNGVRSEAEKFTENVALLNESQGDAIAQLDELAAEIRDEQSLQYVDEVRQQMQAALDQLAKAGHDSDAGTVEPGDGGGTSGLRRAAEIAGSRVPGRSRQQQQSQSRSSSSQQRDGNGNWKGSNWNRTRTATKPRARPRKRAKRNNSNAEVRQVLNRLRELARAPRRLERGTGAQLQSASERRRPRSRRRKSSGS